MGLVAAESLRSAGIEQSPDCLGAYWTGPQITRAATFVVPSGRAPGRAGAATSRPYMVRISWCVSRLTRHRYVGWRVTEMLGGGLQILDGVGYGFWMPKLRVVGLRIWNESGRFGRSVERAKRGFALPERALRGQSSVKWDAFSARWWARTRTSLRFFRRRVSVRAPRAKGFPSYGQPDWRGCPNRIEPK